MRVFVCFLSFFGALVVQQRVSPRARSNSKSTVGL